MNILRKNSLSRLAPLASWRLTLPRVAAVAALAACGGSTSNGTPANDAGKHDSGKDATAEATCNLVQIVNPVLTVTDQATGKHICDAVLVDNDAGAGLYSSGSGSSCTYRVSEFGGASGPFSVTIGAPGYDSAKVSELQVTYCGCNTGSCAPAQQVGISLVPAPPKRDAGIDGGRDSGVDAGTDGGVDAGNDSGVEAGTDSGAPNEGGTLTDSG